MPVPRQQSKDKEQFFQQKTHLREGHGNQVEIGKTIRQQTGDMKEEIQKETSNRHGELTEADRKVRVEYPGMIFIEIKERITGMNMVILQDRLVKELNLKADQ